MKPHGFFLLAVVLCVATQAMAQPANDLQAERMADKLWWILDITKQYQPEFQAHVTLEAPDGERVALTFQGERACTLVQDDVIALERKPGVQPDAPEQAIGEYFIPHRAKWGKPRWWSERAKHEGQEISKGWKLDIIVNKPIDQKVWNFLHLSVILLLRTRCITLFFSSRRIR